MKTEPLFYITLSLIGAIGAYLIIRGEMVKFHQKRRLHFLQKIRVVNDRMKLCNEIGELEQLADDMTYLFTKKELIRKENQIDMIFLTEHIRIRALTIVGNFKEAEKVMSQLEGAIIIQKALK